MQDLLRRYPGVISTGSATRAATCPMQLTATMGRTPKQSRLSSIQKIGFRRLLEFFFQIHDPTTLNRQGNDRGTSYRSAIFYTNEEQQRIAMNTIANVNASGLWPGKVVTEVSPRRSILGGGAGTSGLSGTLSQRLHLPLHSA